LQQIPEGSPSIHGEPSMIEGETFPTTFSLSLP
jgi:hypothetical protein